jgi:hypothetical protein
MGYFEKVMILRETRDLQNNQKGLGLIIIQHDSLFIKVYTYIEDG